MAAYHRDFLLVTILSAVGAWLTANFLLSASVPISFWLCLIFIALISQFIHLLLTRASTKRPQMFVAWFMGALSGKLFLSAMLMVVVGLTDRENLKFTAVGFLIAYVLLTIVEIRHLVPLLRNTKS